MRLERTKNASRNIAWGTFNKLLTTVLSFLMRTIFIKVIGSEYLGLDSLFTSTLSMLSLAELGFGEAMVFSMYEPIACDDQKSINALLNLYKKIYRMVGIVILIVGIMVIPVLPHLINGVYPQDINLTVAYLLALANTVMSYFLFAYKGALLSAYQRNDIRDNITTFMKILCLIVQIILVYVFHNYYLYLIVAPITTCLSNIITAICTKKKFPDLQPVGDISREKFEDIIKKVGALFGHKVGGKFLNSVDSIVISAMLGLNVLAKYTNYITVFNSVVMFAYTCYSAIRAGIGNSLYLESKERNYYNFRQLCFMNSWLLGWCSICLLCLYQSFIELWLGKEMMIETYSTIILFVLYFYIQQYRQIVLTYKDAAGLWKEDMIKPYMESIINLGVNIILVSIVGLNGIILSTIIAITVIAIPWETTIVFKVIFQKKSIEYYIDFLKNTLPVCVAALPTWFLCGLIQGHTWLSLMFKAIVCVFMPNIILLLLYFRRKEFKETLQIIIRMIKK